jgi:tripartite-type tricarboxylate transporter receptor subunit TctC
MTGETSDVRRRRLLRLAAAAPLLAAPCRTAFAARAAGPFEDPPGVLVAGPDGGTLSRWAAAMAPPLGRALPSSAMHETTVGGVDGVTGANQFDSRAAPDGETVLLVPGEAALAWLVGDPRAQFDVSGWLPVLAGATPSVVAGRAALRPGQTVRFAAAGPAGCDLPALLALELLGVRCEPMFGMSEQASLAAFSAGDADVLLLRGAGVPARLAALPDGRPLFTFGALDDGDQIVRDPLLPDVPTLEEAPGFDRASPLREAWCASAAASQLAFALILPKLTPPAMVALWRRAARAAAGAPEMQAMAAASFTRPLATQSATAGVARVAADMQGLLELRRWLWERYGWRPA